jgi:hypothetical protein
VAGAYYAGEIYAALEKATVNPPEAEHWALTADLPSGHHRGADDLMLLGDDIDLWNLGFLDGDVGLGF